MNGRLRFMVVRHGQSIWNHESKFTGWTNIPLTEKGKNDAQNMAFKLNELNLKPDIIFSSALDRAIHTSNVIKNNLMNYRVPLHTSWRLNEKHYGKLEGVPRQYIRNIYGDTYTELMRSTYDMKPPNLKKYPVDYKNEYKVYRNCYYKSIENGESKEDVLRRLLPYYENDILYKITDENMFPLIVTHKHSARVLMKHVLNISNEDFEDYELPSKNIILVNLCADYTYLSHENIPY